MIDIAIFGAGSNGSRAWHAAAARTDIRVVCVADNDARRHGDTLHGVPIVGAGELLARSWDFVVVASMYGRDIGRQLVALGVAPERIVDPGSGTFAEVLASLPARTRVHRGIELADGTTIARDDLPNVLLLTYETLNSSHGTGVLLQRYFADFPLAKLFSVCHTATGLPWLDGSLVLPHAASPAERAAALVSALEARAFTPSLIYATAFNENDLELLDIVLGVLRPDVPVIQHFMDYMPHAPEVFDTHVRRLGGRLRDVWALTEGLAAELTRRYERPVRLVTALHQDPPPLTRIGYRPADAGLRAVMLGNLWQPWTLPLVRAAWARCQHAIPGLRPIDWYVHPARVQALVDAGYDLGDEVVWRGFHGGLALQERLQTADLAIVPFNVQAQAQDGYARFSLPSRLTELCGAGLPVLAIASPDTEPARFLTDRNCGLAVAGPDEGPVADALLALIEDRARRERLGTRARAIAETEFALGPFHQQLVSTFVGVSRARGASPRAGATVAARVVGGTPHTRVDGAGTHGTPRSIDTLRGTDMRVLVTGSNGLIGSEAAAYFDRLGADVVGVDNNMRAVFFGRDGDTRWNQRRLLTELRRFRHRELDIRDRAGVLRLVQDEAPDLIVHCAAQPSHDLAARMPFEDFDVNAVGTLNLLEAVRRHRPEAVFVHMSTNKVYGDAPNERPLEERDTRWEYADEADYHGIDERCRIDRTLHSLFGASKVAADVMVQEYGRYFGLRTGVFRGGCLTGPQHSGVELHGFLSYLVKAAYTGTTYRIYGYKGKQVRDNIHCHDVLRAIHRFYEAPRPGEVYNLGGGRANSCSLLEAAALVEELGGGRLKTQYVDQARTGDHICYISDLRKLQSHYPGWSVEIPLREILRQIIASWQTREASPAAVAV